MQDSNNATIQSSAIMAFGNIRNELNLEDLAFIDHKAIVAEAARTSPMMEDKGKLPALERMQVLRKFLLTRPGIESVGIYIEGKDFVAVPNPFGEISDITDGLLKTASSEVFVEAYYLLRFYMYGSVTRCLLVQDGSKLLFLANDPERPSVWAGHRLL